MQGVVFIFMDTETPTMMIEKLVTGGLVSIGLSILLVGFGIVAIWAGRIIVTAWGEAVIPTVKQPHPRSMAAAIQKGEHDFAEERSTMMMIDELKGPTPSAKKAD